MIDRSIKPCSTCEREACPYEGNSYAMNTVRRKGTCPFNVKREKIKEGFVDPLKASKKAMKVRK